MIRTAPNATIATTTMFRMQVIFANRFGEIIVRADREIEKAFVSSNPTTPFAGPKDSIG
jgi:hypothetical protein